MTGEEAAPWWLCPNDPRCPHGAVLHDIEEMDDPSPRCCADGCDCGREQQFADAEFEHGDGGSFHDR